ncbi:hypothetical protein NMY22_g10153 [Coprinellus aureogranulatus]|nr:hypothetical protein NMY22_g10153 [Coprinellus aureogranulatus]
MDIIATKQAVQYAREWAVDQDKGPLLLEFVTYRYGGHSMSDPGTTYRTREEVQRMRSTQDPIRGLQRYLEEWGIASEQDLKKIDKDAKAVVDKAVEEAKASPEPETKDLWTDIYYKGTEPPFMRGREREEATVALGDPSGVSWDRGLDRAVVPSEPDSTSEHEAPRLLPCRSGTRYCRRTEGKTVDTPDMAEGGEMAIVQDPGWLVVRDSCLNTSSHGVGCSQSRTLSALPRTAPALVYGHLAFGEFSYLY